MILMTDRFRLALLLCAMSHTLLAAATQKSLFQAGDHDGFRSAAHDYRFTQAKDPGRHGESHRFLRAEAEDRGKFQQSHTVVRDAGHKSGILSARAEDRRRNEESPSVSGVAHGFRAGNHESRSVSLIPRQSAQAEDEVRSDEMMESHSKHDFGAGNHESSSVSLSPIESAQAEDQMRLDKVMTVSHSASGAANHDFGAQNHESRSVNSTRNADQGRESHTVLEDAHDFGASSKKEYQAADGKPNSVSSNSSSSTQADSQAKLQWEKKQEFAEWVRRIDGQISGRKRWHSTRDKQRPFLFNNQLTDSGKFLVVDRDNGDYTSIQDAINAVPVNNTQPVTIYISAGIYQEKVKINESKAYITLQGAGEEYTTIVWDDYAGKLTENNARLNTYHTATVHVSAPYFSARDITFKNAAPVEPAGTQAVALHITGDMASFFRCTFIGIQDTLYDHAGRHYFKNCTILGSVDFIFGNGRSLYKECTLNAIGNGAVTAQKRQNPSDNTGFSFVSCSIYGNGLVYLGRAWGRFSRVVFVNCYMDSVINPTGWDDWGDSSRQTTVFYGEYNCTGPGANGNGRVPWSYTLTEDEAEHFKDVGFIEGEHWLRYQ